MFQPTARLLYIYVMSFFIATAIAGNGTAVQAAGGSHTVPYYIVPAAIKVCDRCVEICEKTLKHCQEQGGEHAKPEHVQAF